MACAIPAIFLVGASVIRFQRAVPIPMPTLFSNRHALLWTGLVLVLLATSVLVGLRMQRAKLRHAPIAAYLVPLGEGSRVKTAWGFSTRLIVPIPLRSGERVSISSGTSARLLLASSGAAELVTGPKELSFQQKNPAEPNAIISPLPELLAALRTNPNQPGDITSCITSPFALTRYLNPLITWNAREGVLYDIAVLDSADPNVPPRVARGVRPPLALADLQTPQRRQLAVDRNYEIIVRETNATTLAAAARFLTTTDAQVENKIPSTPADLIAEATAAMAKMPTRTGDAWLALTRLPADWAQSELGVRLRLRVTAELGLIDEFARAQADARQLLKP